MKKMVFCLSLAWKFMLIMSLTAHGQSAPVPSVPPRPPSVPPTPSGVVAPECGSSEDRVIYASDSGGGTVNALCFNRYQTELPKPVTLFFGAPGVQQILPLPNRNLYAVSNSKVYKYLQYPYGGEKQLGSWRIFGGGFAFNADPVQSDQYGGYWWEPSLSFRFPWEKEGAKFWLWLESGNQSVQPLESEPRLGCVSVVKFRSYEYCLDPKSQTVFRPEKNPFGTRWEYGTEFFAGRLPVNMVASQDKLYVMLATKITGQSFEYGRIVSLGYEERGGGDVVERTVVYNLNVSNEYIDRLAVSSNGLYFLARAAGMYDTIWFYDTKTGALARVFTGQSGERLSGLAVAPPSYGGRG